MSVFELFVRFFFHSNHHILHKQYLTLYLYYEFNFVTYTPIIHLPHWHGAIFQIEIKCYIAV